MKKASISLKRTPERVELIKQMASPDRNLAYEAQQAFAAYIREPVEIVLNQKSTAGLVYTDLPFSKNDRPTIPLDIFLGTQEKHVSIWAQNIAGGLATNLVQGLGEYTFQTFKLESAVSLYKEYIENANLPVLSQVIDRAVNELVVKQERNAWSPVLSSVATASTNGLDHVISATTAGVFQLEDLNQMFVRMDRIWTSYASKGTPESQTGGLTDLIVSPEIVGQIRAFAYNPMNTRGVPNSDESTAVPLPDAVREQIFRAGGMLSIYDVSIHKLLEFGKNAKYNTVFDNAYGGSFDPATQELVLGLDLTKNYNLRPVVDADGGGSIESMVDDQFVARSEKVGWFFRLREGRIVIDTRDKVGLIV